MQQGFDIVFLIPGSMIEHGNVLLNSLKEYTVFNSSEFVSRDALLLLLFRFYSLIEYCKRQMAYLLTWPPPCVCL